MVASIKGKPPLVQVKWNDAHSPAATETVNINEISRVHGTIPIITAGYLLRDDDVGITIGGEDCADGDYRNITFIPRCLVVEVIGKRGRKKHAEEPTRGDTAEKETSQEKVDSGSH